MSQRAARNTCFFSCKCKKYWLLVLNSACPPTASARSQHSNATKAGDESAPVQVLLTVYPLWKKKSVLSQVLHHPAAAYPKLREASGTLLTSSLCLPQPWLLPVNRKLIQQRIERAATALAVISPVSSRVDKTPFLQMGPNISSQFVSSYSETPLRCTFSAVTMGLHYHKPASFLLFIKWKWEINSFKLNWF